MTGCGAFGVWRGFKAAEGCGEDSRRLWGVRDVDWLRGVRGVAKILGGCGACGVWRGFWAAEGCGEDSRQPRGVARILGGRGVWRRF